MDLGFDVIGDLALEPGDIFDWVNKATSLYCIVAGNISKDLPTVEKTLRHLSECYQGVFYIMGSLEYGDEKNLDTRTLEILEICAQIPNVASLFHHVVIIDGIALIGCNGWAISESLDPAIRKARLDDLAYLYKSLSKLQKYLDVKRIIVITNAVPNKSLYFGEHPKFYEAYTPLDFCLETDTENKVAKWIFGTYEKSVDTIIDSIHYVNSPYYKDRPYWAKRVTVRI